MPAAATALNHKPDHAARLRRAAEAAMQRSNGDRLRASSALRKTIADDKGMTEAALTMAAWQAVSEVMHHERCDIRESSSAGHRQEAVRKDTALVRAAVRPDTAADLRAVSAEHWYKYRLYGGVMVLGDALASDLRASITNHRKLASANAFQAYWQQAILNGMDDDRKRVRDVYSEADISRIYAAAERSHHA